MPVPTDSREFHYLPAQARRLGVDTPAAQRISLTLSDGRCVSAVRFGEGEPQVTFLHGAGLNAHTWDGVAMLLGRPSLAIDLAGHGDSSWRTDADYSPASLAADVAEGVRAWTSSPQVLVGHSLGGLTASVLASQHPEMVRALLLVDIVPGLDTDAAPAVLRDFYAVTDFATRDDAVQRAQDFGFGGTREDTERGVFLNTRVRADGRVEWKHHFAHIIGHAFDALDTANRAEAADPWSDLAAVTAPLTLVHGTHGFLRDSDLAEFTRRHPTATTISVEAGHNVQETAPQAIATATAHALATISL